MKATEFIPNFEGNFSWEHHKYYGYPWNKDTLEIDQAIHQNCIDKRSSAFAQIVLEATIHSSRVLSKIDEYKHKIKPQLNRLILVRNHEAVHPMQVQGIYRLQSFAYFEHLNWSLVMFRKKSKPSLTAYR